MSGCNVPPFTVFSGKIEEVKTHVFYNNNTTEALRGHAFKHFFLPFYQDNQINEFEISGKQSFVFLRLHDKYLEI